MGCPFPFEKIWRGGAILHQDSVRSLKSIITSPWRARSGESRAILWWWKSIAGSLATFAPRAVPGSSGDAILNFSELSMVSPELVAEAWRRRLTWEPG